MTVLAGIVEEVRPILTKGGEHMAFLKIADYTDKIEAVLFPRAMEKYKSLVAVDRCLAFKGRLSGRNNETSLVIEAVKEL